MKDGEIEKGKWYYNGKWDGKNSSKHYTHIMKALSERFNIDDDRDRECTVCRAFKISQTKKMDTQSDFYLWQTYFEAKEITDTKVIEKLETVYREFNENPNRNKLEKFVDSL